MMAKAGHSSFLLEGPAPSGPVRRRSPCLPWRIKKEFHHPFTRIRGHTGVHGEEGAEYWSMGVLEDLFAGGEWVSGYRERVKRKSEFQSNSKFPISWFQVSPFIPASGPAEAGTTNIEKSQGHVCSSRFSVSSSGGSLVCAEEDWSNGVMVGVGYFACQL